MEDNYKKYMKSNGKLDYDVLWGEIRGITGFMAKKRREEHYYRTHWIEKQDVSRFPNIPVSFPAKRNLVASIEYKGNLDNGSYRSDYRLDCWQYMNNKCGSRITTGYWMMAGRYE